MTRAAPLVLFFLLGFSVLGGFCANAGSHRQHSRPLGGHHINKIFYVGDSAGWTTGGGTNLTAWAYSKTFHAGDTIVFKYDKRHHSVLQVDLEAYRSCNNSSPAETYTTGHDSITLQEGHYLFIDGITYNCKKGQKVSIRVPAETASPTKYLSSSGVVPSSAGYGGVSMAVAIAALLLVS